MMENLLQIALLAGIGFLLVNVGIDLLKKHSYEQLSERYGLQAELENCLPEAKLAKPQKMWGQQVGVSMPYSAVPDKIMMLETANLSKLLGGYKEAGHKTLPHPLGPYPAANLYFY